MYIFKKAKLNGIFKINNVIKQAANEKYDFYSNHEGMLFKKIIKRNVYYIIEKENKRSIISGVIFVEKFKKQILFFPNENISFIMLINLLREHGNLSNYILNIKYRNIDLYNCCKDNNIEILKNIKCMVVKTSKLDCENIFDIKFSNMNINYEETERVKLQNKIFGYINGRRELTLEEVYNEECDISFLNDMCFFICKDNVKIGYGQIIKMKSQYYLVNFGILPEYRCNGYGYYFLSKIISTCYKKGIKELYLTVDNLNLPAIKLYEKVLFKEIYNSSSIIL